MNMSIAAWRARRVPGRLSLLALGAISLAPGCGAQDRTDVARWQLGVQSPDAALMSVSGTSASDVWMVGASDASGALALHYDGSAWQREPTSGVAADLWWVHALPGGVAFMSGSDATLLVRHPGGIERLTTPGLGAHVVFGVWAAALNDVYAVGSAHGRNGFVWHYDGRRVDELPLPAGLPLDDNRDAPGFFKVWGRSPTDVWVVGDRGVVLHGDASRGFALVPSGTSERLFTVSGSTDRVVIVGGSGNGVALEASGAGPLLPVTPPGAGLLQGVSVSADDAIWSVGIGGNIYSRQDEGSPWQQTLAPEPVQSLHAAWVDPDGGVWAAGGNVLVSDLDGGVALHYGFGPTVPALELPSVEPPAPVCPPAAVDPEPDGSIARRWNEQVLGAIRRDLPRPTVHARNLYHLSVALWDAWAAYDPSAGSVIASERQSASDVEAARREALSYAAYRVLSQRYAGAIGGAVSQACFDAFMGVLGYDPADAVSTGATPRALGNRVGAAVLAAFANDGSNEAGNYADPAGYEPGVPALAVEAAGTSTEDPTRWQPLLLAEAVTQNGINLGSGVQGYVGSQWGTVTPFALAPEPAASLLSGTPGLVGAPLALDAPLVAAVVDIIQRSADLDITDGVRWDISPGAYGNNPLGSNDGHGRPENPVTGQPYAAERVLRGDFARVLAEYWADGPQSETPPGHWNTIANHVADDPLEPRLLYGQGSALDPLAWDVHVYLALNGALHDAAVAAWGIKRQVTTARPITWIRYMGERGQSSDPAGPAYHPQGLPLVPGLIERVDEASSAPGERHAALARYVGQIAIRAWPGEPGDREHDVSPARWILARDWLPYQRRFFVSPAFPGYVSGHSTFSRAAAVVLHRLTGSELFPGGLGRARFEPGYLVFEHGPSEPVELEWASYYDAADQAGQSRLWSGIHLLQDDFDGRRVGALVGDGAVRRARDVFEGGVPPR